VEDDGISDTLRQTVDRDDAVPARLWDKCVSGNYIKVPFENEAWANDHIFSVDCLGAFRREDLAILNSPKSTAR
jgi:hypothetical protein